MFVHLFFAANVPQVCEWTSLSCIWAGVSRACTAHYRNICTMNQGRKKNKHLALDVCLDTSFQSSPPIAQRWNSRGRELSRRLSDSFRIKSPCLESKVASRTGVLSLKACACSIVCVYAWVCLSGAEGTRNKLEFWQLWFFPSIGLLLLFYLSGSQHLFEVCSELQMLSRNSLTNCSRHITTAVKVIFADASF